MSIASLNTLLSGLMDWLLCSTVQASVLICVILCVHALLRHRLAARWRYCLWFVLVLRMVMPWAPESRVSMFNAVPPLGPAAAAPWVIPDGAQSTAPAAVTSLPVHEPDLTPQAAVVTSPHPAASLAPGAIETVPGGARETPVFIRALPLIWLAISLALAARVFMASFLLYRRVRRHGAMPDRAILDLLADCASRMRVRTSTAVLLTNAVSAPMLFGFVRPRLLLPPEVAEGLTLGELRHVLLHELAHVKRRDVLVGWVTALLQTVHWFNPLVWLAFRRMRADREEACDALVLAHASAGESKDYGRTIVRLLERWSRPRGLPGTVGVLESRSQLKRRIAMIAQFRKGSYRASLLGLCLLAVACAVSLTDAQTRPGDKPAGVQPALGQAPPGNPQTEVVFRLSDGTSLIGTTEIRAFRMQLSDAQVDTIIRKVSAQGVETWSVEFQNGDRLTGVLNAGSLELLTSLGKGPLFTIRRSLGAVEIPLDRVARMARAKDGQAWTVEFQNGDKLSGRPQPDSIDVATQFGKLSVSLEKVERVSFAVRTPLAPGQLPGGLILHYRFDTPGAAVDESGTGNNGTIQGAEFAPVGRLGGALHFDGNSYVRCGDIRIGPEVTYSAWIKLDTLATGSNFYVCRAGEDHATLSGHHYTIELLGYGGRMLGMLEREALSRRRVPGEGEPGSSGGWPRLRACGASASIVDGKYAFTDSNQWYHIAVTVDAGNILTIYVNGEEDISGAVTTTEVQSLYIGKSGFKGLIDEFMVFDRALSRAEVAWLYQLPGSAETAGTERVANESAETIRQHRIGS